MPPCPKCGQTTADNDGWNYCATCGIRFRFEEGGGFTYAGNAEKPLNLARDWPYFGDTVKWSGVRPKDSTEHITIDLDLPQLEGTRRQSLLIDMYIRWRESKNPDFDRSVNSDHHEYQYPDICLKSSSNSCNQQPSQLPHAIPNCRQVSTPDFRSHRLGTKRNYRN